jgi:hypothetical protein
MNNDVMLNRKGNRMRVNRNALTIATLFLCIHFVNAAFAQGQPGNSKQAPETNTQTVPLGKKLENIYGRLKEGTDAEGKAIDEIKNALGNAKIKLQDAAKMVDQLIEQLNKQHAAMDPNGEISKAISDLEGEARRLAGESQRDNDTVNQKRFEEAGKRLSDARERMNKLYKESTVGITQLDKSRRHITRGLQAGILEEASSQLEINLDAIERSKQDRDKIIEIINEAHPATGF